MAWAILPHAQNAISNAFHVLWSTATSINLDEFSDPRKQTKMAYNYEKPTSDVFDFFVYSFVGSVIALILTGREDFKNTLHFQYVVTFCVTASTYLFPAIILGRLVFCTTTDSPTIPRLFLLVELGVCILFYLLTILTLVFKHFSKKTRHLGLLNLHEHIDSLKAYPWLWHRVMGHFFFRFIGIYLFYIPLSILGNLCFIILFNPPTVEFDDVLFFIAFVITLAAASWWLWVNVGAFQSLAHCELLLNCFILCYFMSDDTYISKMLLSSLSIYIACFYSVIRVPKPAAFYSMPIWFYFQIVRWKYYRDTPLEQFKTLGPQALAGRGKTFQKYHNLLYKADDSTKEKPLPTTESTKTGILGPLGK